MFNRWIVVADSSRARIFSYHGVKAELRELDDLSHPESRLHERDLTADLPGRSFDSAGQGRHAMEQPVSAKEQEARLFAAQIAAYLDKACNENRLDSLIVIAAPEFLGHLRAGLSTATREIVSTEIKKNLVQQTPDQIRAHISESAAFV